MAGTLYLIATPIGNLGDISKRALEILNSVHVIACEDTRRTGRLLKEFGVGTELMPYHDHIEAETAAVIGDLLSSEHDVAVVSDAGMPGIADPGFRAVNEAIERGADVRCIPGPSAITSALAVSGLPSDAFFFGGFLPAKHGERLARLRQLADIPATLVFFETPHRIEKSVADCIEALGDRAACLVRELTKLHEECIRGDLSEILDEITREPRKGEMVLLIDRSRNEISSPSQTTEIIARYEDLLAEGTEARRALKILSREFGITRSEVYRIIHIPK